MARDEIAIIPRKMRDFHLDATHPFRQLYPQAIIIAKNNTVICLKIPEPIVRKEIARELARLRSMHDVRQASPVFYRGKQRRPETRMVLTGEIIVQFPSEHTAGRITSIEKTYALERLRSYDFSKNTFLYGAGDPLNSVDVANRLYESGQVNYAYPHWLSPRGKRADPNDPLFPDQWYLRNTGQGGGTPGEDVNIAPVGDTPPCMGQLSRVFR